MGAGLAIGQAAESNLTHSVRHTEASLRATVGYRLRLDLAWVGLELGAGGALVLERRARHQASRLQAAGLEAQASSSAWTAGPVTDLALVVHLFVLDRWALVARGGPRLGWLKVQDDLTLRVGWSGSLGVAYRLGGGDP